MTLHNAPPSLQTLTLQLIARHVTQKGLQLLHQPHIVKQPHVGCKRKCLESSSPEIYRDAASFAEVTSTMEELCTQVRDLLHTRIPYICADEVTLEIMKQLNENRFQILLCTESSQAKVVFRNFLAAILNPEVRNLDLSRTCNYIARCVLCELQAAPNLKQLKYVKYMEDYNKHVPLKHRRHYWDREDSFISINKHMSLRNCKHLEYVTLEDICTDEMLRDLSETCPQLKGLDVNGSMNVSYCSREYIERFRHLKRLNIQGTALRPLDQISILENFSIRGHHALEFYGYDFILSNTFFILKQLCPTLQELSVRFRKAQAVVVTPFGNFQNISVLKIESYTDDYFSRLVTCIPRLEALEINGNAVDVTVIMRNCLSLKRLSVTSHRLQVSVTTDQACSSLQHLSICTRLFAEAAELIAKCKNLLTLEVLTYSDIYCSNMASITSNNQLTYLEEISLGTRLSYVPEDVVTLLCSHCPNLTVFRVLVEDTAHNPKYQDCPGVIRDSDRWFQITKLSTSQSIYE